MSEKSVPPAIRKEIKKLQQRAFRESSGLALIEGESQVKELLVSTAEISYCLVTKSVFPHFSFGKIPVYEVSTEELQYLSGLKTTPQILAVAHILPSMFKDLNLKQPIIFLDGVADPGNLGTILRTAEWFGVTQCILGSGSVDALNPKVIRAAMGSLLRMKVVKSKDPHAELRILAEQQYHLVATTPTNEKAQLPEGKICFLFGSEAHGLSPIIQQLATDFYTISRTGKTESLNVAVAFGITLFNWRQGSK